MTNQKKYIGKPGIISAVRARDNSCTLVAHADESYPIELRGLYREHHPELGRLNIWQWHNMMADKYPDKITKIAVEKLQTD